MTIKYDEDFENSAKCWIFDNAYVECDVKVRDHCHVTVKYRGSARRLYTSFFNFLTLLSKTCFTRPTRNSDLISAISDSSVTFSDYQRSHLLSC